MLKFLEYLPLAFMIYQFFQDREDRADDRKREKHEESQHEIDRLKADNHNYYNRTQDLMDKNLGLNTELDETMTNCFKIKRTLTRLIDSIEAEGYTVDDDGNLVPMEEEEEEEGNLRKRGR